MSDLPRFITREYVLEAADAATSLREVERKLGIKRGTIRDVCMSVGDDILWDDVRLLALNPTNRKAEHGEHRTG